MVSFTTNKSLALPTVSSDSGVWGTELNNSMISLLDNMLGGVDSIALSAASPYTLSSTEIQNVTVKCTGTLLANITVYSACIGFYFVENNTTGNFTVTWQANFGSGGVGTGWNVPQGSRTLFISDTTAGARPVSGDIVGSLRSAGSISPFAGSSAPAFSLLCYGQAVSRTIYSYLFAAIGTTYGSGDGSTTFNVPDLRGRALFGLDNMGGTPAGRLTGSNTGNISSPTTLGSAGGEENHIVLTAEMPNHTHTATVTDPGHLHTMNTGPFVSGSQIFLSNAASSTGQTEQTNSATTGISVSNAAIGGGGSHNTTPPAMVMNWIIRT